MKNVLLLTLLLILSSSLRGQYLGISDPPNKEMSYDSNISSRGVYNKTRTLVGYDEFSYNPDGTIQPWASLSFEYYEDRCLVFGEKNERVQIEYLFDNNKISSFKKWGYHLEYHYGFNKDLLSVDHNSTDGVWRFNYDVDGVLVESIRKFGESSVATIKKYIYNSNGDILEINEYEELEDNSPELQYNTSFEYSGDVLLKMIRSSLQSPDIDYYNSTSSYYYNSDGRIYKKIINNKDGVKLEMVKYFYDANGNRFLVTSSIYDKVEDEWVLDRKDVYEYDYDVDLHDINLPGSITKTVYPYEWFEVSPTYKYKYLIPRYENGTIVNFVKSLYAYKWDQISQDWIKTYGNIYILDDISLSDKDVKMNDIKVYPNPATDYVIFRGNLDKDSSVKVFDTNGVLVIESRLDSSMKLDVSRLSSGLFIYELSTGTNIRRGKILIKK